MYMSGYAGGAASDFEDRSKVPEVLAKPFTVTELRGAVHRALAVRA